MKRKRKKKQPKVFRTMKEFRETFFPGAEEEKRKAERDKDPAKYGTGLVEKFARMFQEELQARTTEDNQEKLKKHSRGV